MVPLAIIGILISLFIGTYALFTGHYFIAVVILLFAGLSTNVTYVLAKEDRRRKYKEDE